MRRIDSEGSDQGQFINENAQQGISGTIISAQWLNAVQEELSKIVEGFNETLNTEKNDQIYQILANKFQELQTSTQGLESTLQKELSIIQGQVETNNILHSNRVGEIIMTFSNERPKGFLACDGASYNQNDYPQLIQWANLSKDAWMEKSDIGTQHHINAGYWGRLLWTQTKFYVPQLSGMFLRGKGSAGASWLGNYQEDQIKEHNHNLGNGWVPCQGGYDNTEGYGYRWDMTTDGDRTTRNTGGEETRPKNIAVNFWINHGGIEK